MKKYLLIVLFSAISFGQNTEKQELLREIDVLRTNTIMNIPYDVPKQKLWEAIYVMMKQEYTQITSQDYEKGIIEGYAESNVFKESFKVEIIGSQPYRIVFSMKKQDRYIDKNGNYSGWYDNNVIPNPYLYKIQLTIYKVLYGEPNSQEYKSLLEKINVYNEKQKKDKNKIIAGRDY
jgi:hypothetical protein